jgi:two-component system NtrC family sensor kinase
LRRNIVLVTAIVALVPLVILTLINYVQDREAYRIESRLAISQILSNTKRTLEFVIEERRSALALVIREKSYGELSSDSALAATVQNLRNSFGGFIDIGLIDSRGIQVFYTGPYDLKNRNYEDQTWFHEVKLRGSYVSDVFMGHRKFPHFVVAFKHEKDLGDFYILRATIDMELINHQVYSLNLDHETDAFIVNQQGVLQTESIFYGSVMDTIPIPVPTLSRSREVVEEYRDKDTRAIIGHAYIEGTPFVLMIIKRLENPFAHWISHRSNVLWFILVSATVILIVIMYGSNRMAKQLREADLRRVRAFHNIEYTNKMATIGRMAAGVAHEINNPMAIINEKAGLIKDLIDFSPDFPQGDKMSNLVNSILNSVERCSKVTHRLLGFAKRMEVHKEQIDLEELIKEVVGFQKTEAVHRNIELAYDFQKNLPLIESDRGQLQQVFLNIITNSFAAIKDGGRVQVSVMARDNNSLAVAVQDNGSGISEEDLKHIFEPFFSTKGEFGTGLGLSITRDIVEKLGGEIDVHSELGKGTRFTVTLPLKKPEFSE